MAAERVLVTGATGFTGGHLCERLAREGYRVRALIRNHRCGSELERLGVEIVKGDLRVPESLNQAMRQIDVVYHIAALFRPGNATRNEMWENNVQGTQNLLNAAAAADVQRFVHCSTIGVHGDVKNPPANEESPYGPGDCYQESKTAAEKIVLRCMKERKMPAVVFRPGGIYGPRDLRFLKLLRAIKNRRFIMLGSGEVTYQMIYIDDLVDGIMLCGTKSDALGKVYILTGSEPTTLKQLVKLIAEVLEVPPPRLRFPVMPVYIAGFACELLCKPFGINPPLYRRRVDFFRKTRAFDIFKAKTELGFRPKTDFRTGIKMTADWYRANGYL